MTEYNFDYESLLDRINFLEQDITRLKDELVETDNTLYEILNRLDKLENYEYNLKNFSLGE